MTESPDYAQNPFYKPAHNRPAESSQLTGLSQNEIETLRKNLIESIVQVVVQAVVGIFVPGDGSAIEQLADWAEALFDDVPVLGDIVEAITGILGGDLGDLSEWASNVPVLSTILEWFGLDPEGDETDILSMITGFLTGDSPLDALNLFNIGNILGTIGIGNLSTEPEEMLDNPGFRELISIQGGGIWTWDVAKGRSVAGSAKTTAGSVARMLRSNLFRLAPGDKGTPEIWAQWSGLTYTGTKPVRLELVEFSFDPVTDVYTVVDTVEVYAPASPGATQATWLRFFNENYVAPGGVTHGCLQLTVGGNATAGNVWFDDASFKKTGLLEIDWISGLSTFLEGFTSGIPIINQIVAAIIPGGAPGDLGDLDNIFTDLFGLLGDPADVGTGTPTVSPIAHIPVFGGLLDGLFRGFTGILDMDADQAVVADAAEGISNTLTGTASGLAQLQAALSPGNPDSDDFERSNSGNWGGGWLVMEDGVGGNASVDGHNAVWEADYGGDSEVVCRRLTKVANGQNQTVAVVLASSFTYVTDGTAAVDLWLRQSEFTTWATRTGMRMRFWGNRDLELAWFNNGTKVWSQAGTSPQAMSNGANLTFQAGEGLAPRRFIAKVNSQPVMDYTEVGTASSLTNLWRGAGARGEFSLIMFPPLEIQPGKFKQWTATG